MYLLSVLYLTNVVLSSIIESTASFSQYRDVMMATVGCSLPVSWGMSLTSFSSEKKKFHMFRFWQCVKCI